MKEPQVYLNGQFVSASSASLGLTDTGLVQGAAITEQLRTFGGKIHALDEHLDRLEHSLQIAGIASGLTRSELAAIASQLVDHNHRLLANGDDLGVSIFVTPGPYAAYSPAGPAGPTVCLHTYPLQFRLWADKYRTGQALVVSRIRQVPGECWPSQLKCRSRMHYYLADREAAQAELGARALLLDEKGFVSETSTANVLMYRANEGLISPRKGTVLPGISMAATIGLARQVGIDAIERDLTPQELASADEVLLTSTPLCLLAVTRLDGQPVASGQPGEIYRCLLAAWEQMVGLDIVAQAERFADR